MLEVVAAFGGGEVIEKLPTASPQSVDASFGGALQQPTCFGHFPRVSGRSRQRRLSVFEVEAYLPLLVPAR